MEKPDLLEENINSTTFSKAISERYLSYALSTITSRSLPDVRDGLKPVHRRVLYAMLQLKLNHNLSFKKSARVVGDVMGKFHPHGDAAIYESMVRMAQEFALRYPLVDGQGNFGNIDGDNAAAMRYTEARMTKAAELLLLDIDKDTVDFRVTYDDEGKEPVVLPSAFPNLLANGSQGIAVGMATSIPPHNISELVDALLHLIKAPNASDTTISNYIKGPDFPTGGILVEPKLSIEESYRIGKGGFKLRARWLVEKLKGGQWQIIVTEIPYQVQKSRLLEKIAELMENKTLPMLSDIRDESTENIRLVVEPKSRNLLPEMIMETLFKKTDLETRVSLNLNVIDDKNIPGVKSLKETLKCWLDHRQIILQRKSQHRLSQIENRINILNGYITVYLNLDKVIEIIREEDKPKEVLISFFKINEIQANAILDMRLRSLRKLEEIELKKELGSLQNELFNMLELAVYFTGDGYASLDGWGLSDSYVSVLPRQPKSVWRIIEENGQLDGLAYTKEMGQSEQLRLVNSLGADLYYIYGDRQFEVFSKANEALKLAKYNDGSSIRTLKSLHQSGKYGLSTSELRTISGTKLEGESKSRQIRKNLNSLIENPVIKQISKGPNNSRFAIHPDMKIIGLIAQEFVQSS